MCEEVAHHGLCGESMAQQNATNLCVSLCRLLMPSYCDCIVLVRDMKDILKQASSAYRGGESLLECLEDVTPTPVP